MLYNTNMHPIMFIIIIKRIFVLTEPYTHVHLLTCRTGTSSQPIWLDYLDSCTSSETCLTSCEACPLLANSDCAHAQDVTLQCR